MSRISVTLHLGEESLGHKCTQNKTTSFIHKARIVETLYESPSYAIDPAGYSLFWSLNVEEECSSFLMLLYGCSGIHGHGDYLFIIIFFFSYDIFL